MGARFAPPGTPTLATAARHGLLAAADKARLDGWPRLALNYSAAADLANGAALAANTWVTVGAAQPFAVTSLRSLGLAWARGNVFGPNAASAQIGSRLLFDGATPVPLGGGYVADANANEYANFLAGAGPVPFASFSPGTHTVALQIWSNVAGIYFCRAASQPNDESLALCVLELTP